MKKEVKVLQIMGGISPEGIGTFVLNVYENIDKENLDISFSLATKYKQYHEDRIIKQGAKVYRTAEIGDGINGKINHFRNLIKLLKEEGPFDVVHTHMDFFNGINLLAAYIAKVPKRISHAHSAVDTKYLSIEKKIYNFIMKSMINMFATHKLGCSIEANQYMNSSYTCNENNRVINNGIDLSKFNKENYKNKKIIDLDIDESKINFITIGRIDDPKNPLFIVEIINELRKIRNNIHLYWIGSGSLESKVRNLISKYDLNENITLLGIRDDVAHILSQVDFMLFPSKWEGLGIVLVEAQASGVPCFISDTISKEADLGLCKYISLEKNSRQWAEEINNHINNKTYENQLDSDRMSKFDIKNVAKELKKIYIS